MAQIPGSVAATGCIVVTLSAPFLNIYSCLKPVVLLLDLIQDLVDTQVTFGPSTLQFAQHVLHSTPRENYLGYLRSSFGGFPGVL
jgi:hypothetical protein